MTKGGGSVEPFQLELPISSVEVVLKQVNRDLVSDLGQRLLASAFPGFLDRVKYTSEMQSRARDLDIRPLVPINSSYLSQPRRFAGDDTLPNSRYYTVAERDGGDNGTLLRELLAYYDPRTVGPLQLDEVDLGDETVVRELIQGGFRVPPTERALKIRVDASGEQDLIPLSITMRVVDGVLDLRHPDTADAFTRIMSSLKWPNGVHITPLKPRLERFAEMLPTLLGQELGGPFFCKIVGQALRDSGCRGLIYPSARSDCGVSVVNGSVSRAWGWCFVDYTGAPCPFRGILYVDHRSEWDRMIGRGGGIGLRDNGPREVFPDIRLEYVDNGPHESSWQVKGIESRRRRELEGMVESR
jgi:hypothetical protein